MASEVCCYTTAIRHPNVWTSSGFARMVSDFWLGELSGVMGEEHANFPFGYLKHRTRYLVVSTRRERTLTYENVLCRMAIAIRP